MLMTVGEKNSVLDEIDSRILEEVRLDARISYRDLAEKVDLSANAVADRLRRLVKSGVITGFHAAVDNVAAGRGMLALIDLKLGANQTRAGFEEALRGIPGVLSAMLMTGKSDYQLRVACRDAADLDALIGTLRERAGAVDTYSHVVLRELVF